MSYCVNCGVELGTSERYCPLCGVEVNNPAAPFDENAEKPFPSGAEQIRHRTVRVLAARVLSLLLAIPLLSVLLVDLVQDGRLTWSLIPAASIALLFMVAVFPCLFKKPKVWLFMLFGTLEAALFLFVLHTILGGNWLWLFALPITLLTGAATIGCCLITTAKRPSLPLKMIVVLLIVMVYVIVLQMLIEIYLAGRIRLDWSLYIAVACGILSIVVLIVGRLYKKSEAFKKKMFY
ncbi:MAG: zinc ribbon domain-containing protein [Clostridia bacterium]|nr:zinc ribbon domain-containing protein [Clostridia bacterium]